MNMPKPVEDILKAYPALDGQWLVVCLLRDLPKKGKPIRRIVGGLPLVLFRDKYDKPAALLDRCPHRNVPLSDGNVKEGSIQCGYHGWIFGKDGQCERIPGLTNPERCRSSAYSVTSFKTVVQDGLIWVWYQPNNLNTLPSKSKSNSMPPCLPYVHDSKYGTFLWEIDVEASLMTVAENLLDPTHTHFVHPGLVREDGRRIELEATIRNSQSQVEVEYQEQGKQFGWIARLFDKQRTTSYGRFVMPCLAELEYCNPEGTRLLMSTYLTPVSAHQTRAYLTTSYRRSFLPVSVTHCLFKPFIWLAMKQDTAVMAQKTKNIQYFGEENFRSTPLDVIRPSMRKLLQGLSFNAESEKIVSMMM